MRRVIGLLGVLSLSGLAAPALAAMRENAQGERRPGHVRRNGRRLDIAAIFDSLDVVSRSAAFRGGDVTAWYGGGTLDLRQATLDPDGAELRVRAMFGGLEIAASTTWPVEVHSRALLAGAGDARDPDDVDPSLPTLVIDAQAIFGGVAIVGVPDDFRPALEVAPADLFRVLRPVRGRASGMGLWYVALPQRIAQTAP